jgi:NAD(P)-dependent dehydrogenase (short-subunit alcohol dehydrogenase family)
MKTILVIGGSSGIGEATAKMLSEQGNKVFATYNTHPVSSSNNGIEFYPLNVKGEDLDFSYLPEVLDGFVYCPGTINLKPFNRLKTEDFRDDFELQILGFVKCLQHLLPRLKASPTASVVLFSSVAVQCGLNFHTQVSTTKGALEGLTRALAAEFAPKIRFNCIAPSLTRTPLAEALLNTEQKVEANALRHPLKRIGEAEDIAHMADFLLGDKSSWMSGQIIHLDGGFSSLRV